ncbi:MAG: glyoxalase/bleomycin resistance/extradiol dioxygenase family protein [Flavobacterium psychrophilum]|nr:MAG: glyoxalase/bleomycin resistance/extradiol dioxygenase family protein [Flavobacterium psychrophilum]
MQTILGLRTVGYKVSDITKAKEWYTKAFNTVPYFDEPFYVGFNIAGYELGLQPDDSVKGDNVVTYWGVEDIEAEYERFISLGATEHETPQNVGGDIMVASVKDPWGNIIGLIYNPEFKLP